MPTFDYKPRSHFDIESRVGQNREGPKVPKADEETPCVTCSHPKTFHCKKFRRGEKPRSYLWVWNPQQPRFRAPAICTHYDPSNPLGVPLCSSTACAVADCNCASFLSPYRKPSAPKKATTKKKTSAPRKKRATKAQAQQQLEFEMQDCPALSDGEVGTCLIVAGASISRIRQIPTRGTFSAASLSKSAE